MSQQTNRLQKVSYWLYGSLALFVVFVLVAWNTLNTVKVQGPLFAKIEQQHELIADILPPPLDITDIRQRMLEIHPCTAARRPRPLG
ncbi:MAG: hypothetical protein C4336_03730, partial [Armatimonadota bacterium]